MKNKFSLFMIFSLFIAISFYIFHNVARNPARDISSTFHKFPEKFKWCVATSAHQIEGNNIYNDWWAWEQIKPSKIKNGDRSLMATDHWNRYAEDIQLMKYLGVTEYRFSVEWSRIEPTEGNFNQEAIKHYRDEILELKKNGINPMVTLHHFTSPKWFADLGGWAQDSSVKQFKKYTEFVNQNIGDLVEYWITFNEPMVMLAGGYINGVFPPGIKDWKKVSEPLKNVLLAHAEAYRELHKNKLAKVGIAHHLRIMQAFSRTNPIEWFLARKLSKSFNWAIPNALKDGELDLSIPTKINYKITLPSIKNTQDFLGINYYSRDLIRFSLGSANPIQLIFNRKNKNTDLGWEIFPTGIYTILEDAHELYPELPIFITENGIADKKDKNRNSFINDHLNQIYNAIKIGIPVKGYCHWSLLDNFEWAEGFHPRFGLYEVNYETFERTPRPSALYYKSIIERNGLNQDDKY